MRLDLDNRLRLSHRKIFLDPDPADRLAAFDFELQIDDGWYTLLDVLCTDLQRETDAEGAPQVKAMQVKEKLGRLRFRVRDASERQRAMIFLAESLSERTCEVCGAPADELLALERTPRCAMHGLNDSHEENEQTLSFSGWIQIQTGRLKAWRKRSKFRGARFASLHQAIRIEDTDAVRRALRAGANPNACTFETDGFRTPLELAHELGNADILNLIKEALE